MADSGELRIYNSLTRNTETFQPSEPGRAKVYLCGPTVYDVPHAGHVRGAVAFDVLVRRLQGLGLEVTYVRNVTDIDDKILKRAEEAGESPLALARRMEEIYRQQMALVGCLAPDHEPRVSEHLPAVIALVERLLENGAAYVQDMPSGTRDVYFSVRSFPGYGKLSRRNIDDLLAGARVAKDETKRDPLDFALWKGVAESEWGWASPWGRGRPGWHIECSAMSFELLGHGFDIHGGGMDLIFPHHENEIAQSEAAYPGRGNSVRYWMHNGFLNVDKEKMSKSLGNFVTVSDVLSRNDPEAFRWFLLSAHYRGPIQFETEQHPGGRVVFPGVDEAECRVDYLYATLRRLLAQPVNDLTVPAKLPSDLLGLRDAARAAVQAAEDGLNDDLNTPVALASLQELARIGNEVADMAARRRKDQAFVAAASVASRAVSRSIEQLASSLGVLRATPDDYAARTTARRLSLRGLSADEVAAKVQARVLARERKDFARADELRAELAELGVELRDGPQGTEWSVRP